MVNGATITKCMQRVSNDTDEDVESVCHHKHPQDCAANTAAKIVAKGEQGL